MSTSILLIISSILVLLISLFLTSVAIFSRKFKHYLSLLSFIFLILGLMLVLVFILLSILMPTASRSNNTVVSYGYFEVVTGIVSAAIVLVNAFLVKPYFMEVTKTGNDLDVNIGEVTVKNIEGKKIDERLNYSSSVIQCSLRLRSEHFAVPIYAKNAIGWVALINKINKARNIELHAGYAPWGYSHHYVLDIVGEESLILFFIPCPDKECRKYAYQLKDNLRANRGQIRLIFPVRPADIRRYGGSFIHLPTQYPFICPVFPCITIADVREFENWDQGLATEFEICINKIDYLHLRVRAGGENTAIYEDEFELREVITSCVDDYLRRN